eukprot:COSAG06_NODE_4197_length_4485_cov_7.345645_4_plen_106_part_00
MNKNETQNEAVFRSSKSLAENGRENAISRGKRLHFRKTAAKMKSFPAPGPPPNLSEFEASQKHLVLSVPQAYVPPVLLQMIVFLSLASAALSAQSASLRKSTGRF